MAQTLNEERDTDELPAEAAGREVNPAALGRQAASEPTGRGRSAA